MILARRKFLTGVASLFAAPAIVRSESLMKIVVSRRRLTVGSWRADEDFGQATGERSEFKVLDPIDAIDPSPGFPPFRGP